MTIDAITPGARVLCAVSGGVDSMYLLYRMTELAAQRGFTVGCAHFNHGLRGAESDRDEAFVRTQCAHLGVPFYAGRGDVASVRGMGTEGAARQLRYAFLTDCAAAHGYDWIATAHTADDNAETLLLNLARGCGLRGLTGIPPQRGKLLRPMLDTTRAEAEAYLAAHGIAHVEDSTNASDAYARNRVRHHAVPALESVNAAFMQHAADTAALLREDERFLSGLAAEFLAGQTPAQGIPTAELLAQRMASRKGMSSGDVQSVLIDLPKFIEEALMEGESVTIKGLGSFHVAVTSDGFEHPDDVMPGKVRLSRVYFRPDKSLVARLNSGMDFYRYPLSRYFPHDM
ncbi:MAG: tRNA lysidine(34) synthetase TilS, partial [Clostridiales bacterium]|nr:tRNA lysidine(34) synthetase TilS [Clostridiales bacterium]